MDEMLETREAQALYGMALEKMRRNIMDGAMVDLQRALQLEPENPLYLSYYGVCLAHRQRLDEALAACKRALRDQPRNTELRVNLGKVYRMGGDTERAYSTFLQAWQANRGHPGPATELARMGVRRPPVLAFLPRSHWCNRGLGRLRWRLERALTPRTV